MKIAILVDGGFYRKRATRLFGDKSAKDRADELQAYCMKHVSQKNSDASLYRIFYYDCPPLNGFIYDPIEKKNINMEKSETYLWTTEFFKELTHRRKFAIRRGELLQSDRGYCLNTVATKDLLAGRLQVGDITKAHLVPNFQQKGVDIKIGIDIIHLAYKKLVDQIVLITGDSDFVPAAKVARTEGIDVILDSMGSKVTDKLAEHVDGMNSFWRMSSH